jgi:cytochrome c peroxidase
VPRRVDLGLWNVYANPDFAASQPALQSLLSIQFGTDLPEELVPKTIAQFKTSGLRDLGHSAPYLHTGQSSTLESVVFFDTFTSDLARANRLRNGDTKMAGIFLSKRDLAPLAAFLRSLNEDYP